mmetsp:Transcript_16537/g.56349  ORF Transcript_16537/g.56349 Transcript_16537/m.56349 type:complete len:220 (-) Transcript_16537:138-797(-)
MELIQSSFSRAESAMKYIDSLRLLISKAVALFSVSSAPRTVRHLDTSRIPLGTLSLVTASLLNQNILPCFSTNQRLRHVFITSPCFMSHPQRSGLSQNSTVFSCTSAASAVSVLPPPNALSKKPFTPENAIAPPHSLEHVWLVRPDGNERLPSVCAGDLAEADYPGHGREHRVVLPDLGERPGVPLEPPLLDKDVASLNPTPLTLLDAEELGKRLTPVP